MICTVCYSNRPVAKRIPMGFPPETKICTGCAIDFDKTLGYLALNGHGLMLSLDGQLHLVDIESGQAWPTSLRTLTELGDALVLIKGDTGPDVPLPPGNAPPAPSEEPEPTETPVKPRK